MAQPPQDLSYLDYGAPPNRSPSSRPSYTGAFGGGLSLPRQTQRPFDPPMGSTALYPSDRHGGYHPRGMDNMNNGGGMPSYLLDNNHQHWSQGGSGVATVNGAVNGPSRQRSVGRRAALPQVGTTRCRLDRQNVGVKLTYLTELDRSRRYGVVLQHAGLPKRPQWPWQRRPSRRTSRHPRFSFRPPLDRFRR